jgi:type I restriction-modification system DNA methylase subunit/restriction endonuclease S subunit
MSRNVLTNCKKLKQNTFIDLDDTSSEINTLKNTMIAQTNSVSNKEALKDKIHEIHNYLRNNGAGYGMNALKVFNILYGLKKIEENNLLDKVSLKRPYCEFSHLLDLANKDEGEILASTITIEVLDSVHGSELKEFMYYDIPKNIKGSVYVYLIKEIDKITLIEKTCNVLLSGKIYEYFIGRDESAISELGAYFTDRHIVDYILKKLDPSTNEDGSISSMIDMFGGSGGFTTGYINYLNDKYPLINWNSEINKISHFDMNEDVIKSAGLEFFCLTGVLPNMDNLKYKNSFTDEFGDKKYKYPLTNPPYGGDKSSKSEGQGKREKVKEYIKNELLTITDEGLRNKRQKQLKDIDAQEKQEKKENDKTKVSVSMCSGRIQKFAKDNGLKGNDKESCSLMLLMDILEVGGTAIGVLKEGVFFNRQYKDIRKCLVENFNVREVISIPQDQFENTSTKTSIVIFDNTIEKTQEVKFSDLSVDRYAENKFAEVFGDIMIVENKGDIIGVSDILVSVATKDEIITNNICSLNSKDYNKKEVVVGEGYELVKLCEITDINMGSTPSTKNHIYWDNGNIPWVSIADLTNNNTNVIYDTKKKLTECGADSMKNRKIPIGSILLSFKLSIGKLGIAGRELYCNEAITYLNSKKEQIPQLYLYYILETLNLEEFGRGTIGTNGNLNKEILQNIVIPIPKSQAKIQEWVDKISAPYDEKNLKTEQISELETFIQNRIKEIGENEECDEVELGSICEFKSGKFNTCDMDNKGIYPFYNATIKSIGFHSEYCFDKDKYLLLIKSGNVKAVGLGSVIKVKGKIACVTDVVQVISTINIDYLFTILNLIKDKIRNTSNGSVGLGHLKMSEVKKIKIKIPKNKQLINEMEVTFRQIETINDEIKLSEELYKQYIQELSQEALPQQQPNDIQIEASNDSLKSEIATPIKIKIKKIKQTL